jgi:hypothetical protein
MFGVLTPWVVWRTTRAAGLERGAWVAALLVATSVLHIQLSTHERPWVPMTFFIALAAWGAIVHVRDGGARPLILSGLAAGLAFATHPGGLVSLGLAGLAWLLGPQAWKGAGSRRRIVSGALAVAVFVLVAVVLGYPHWIVHGRTEASAVIGGQAADVHLGGMSAVLRFRWATFERLGHALFGYEPGLLVLALPGLWFALRRRVTACVALWTLVWSAWFMTNWSDHVRYLLPTSVLLALPAGLCAERLLRRRSGALLVVLLLALSLVQGMRLAVVLGREDTRAEAESRLQELAAEVRVAIDRYGPDVDASLEALETLHRVRSLRGSGLSLRESRRGELLARPGSELLPGIDALPLGDLLEFDQREKRFGPWPELRELGADPRALLAALGVTHLLVVERRPGVVGHDLLASRVDEGEAVWVIDPSVAHGAGPRRPQEAWLPTEMDFPLTALWSVVRPGPRLSLYPISALR